MDSDLASALRLQAKACAYLGSTFSAQMLEAAAADLQDGGPTAALMAAFAALDARSLMDAAVPLRFLGGLHDLALSGDDPGLAAAYPKPGVDLDAPTAWRAARRAMLEHGPRLAEFMEHEPQTNEVRRSVCLLGGFLTIARETGLPLRCFEIAASAGLNLSWDTYRYELGDTAWGPSDSPVVLPTEWRGALPPLDADVRVVERAACDRRPVDLTDPALRRRLLAYVWPDQFERLARISAAIELAQKRGVQVETADAVDWTRRLAAPRAGAATVIYHSVFWQYMPPQSQTALTQVIEDHGKSATPDAPLACLWMEPPPGAPAAMEVRRTLWPGGEERVLADVHPHGAAVSWRA